MNRHTKIVVNGEVLLQLLREKNFDLGFLSSAAAGEHQLDKRTVKAALRGEEITLNSANKMANALGVSIAQLQWSKPDKSLEKESFREFLTLPENIFPVSSLTGDGLAIPDDPDAMLNLLNVPEGNRIETWEEGLIDLWPFGGGTGSLAFNEQNSFAYGHYYPFYYMEYVDLARPLNATELLSGHSKAFITPTFKFAKILESEQDCKTIRNNEPLFFTANLPLLSEVQTSILKELKPLIGSTNESQTKNDIQSFIETTERVLEMEKLMQKLRDCSASLHLLGGQIGTWVVSEYEEIINHDYDRKPAGIEYSVWCRPVLILAPTKTKEVALNYWGLYRQTN